MNLGIAELFLEFGPVDLRRDSFRFGCCFPSSPETLCKDVIRPRSVGGPLCHPLSTLELAKPNDRSHQHGHP